MGERVFVKTSWNLLNSKGGLQGGRVTTRELMAVTDRSAPFLRKVLAGLAERNLLQKNASSNTDPQQYYFLADMPTA